MFQIVSCQDYAVSVLLLVIYVSIYYAIRKNREAHGVDDKDDTSLLKQAVVVAVCLIVFRILSNISGAIRASVYIMWVFNILRFSASVCNNMLNPSRPPCPHSQTVPFSSLPKYEKCKENPEGDVSLRHPRVTGGDECIRWGNVSSSQ